MGRKRAFLARVVVAVMAVCALFAACTVNKPSATTLPPPGADNTTVSRTAPEATPVIDLGREATLTGVPPPVVTISRARALEIALAELAKDWGTTKGIQTPRDPIVRLSTFPGGENGTPAGPIKLPVGKLVWAVQVESESERTNAAHSQGPAYLFQGVFIDPEHGQVLARYGSESKPVLYPAALRGEYSSECSQADPVNGLPPIDPARVIAIAKNAMAGRPAGPNGGPPDFSIADAELIACSGAGSGGPEPSLYWLVTVPAEMSLARCGPVVAGKTELGATCWSGHTYVRISGAVGSVSVGPQVGKQGPLLSALELQQVARVAAAEGWWKVWAVLRGHNGSRPPALFTFALAAYELGSGGQPPSPKTLPLDAAIPPRTYPSLSPREDPANWAAQRSIAFIIVGRIVERTGTFATDRGTYGTESYGLWRINVERLVAGRMPNGEPESVTVRFSDPGGLVRFPIPAPQPGARVVLFLEPGFSMGDPARALDLQPAAMPGMNGVIKVEENRVRIQKGETTVEEPLNSFLERVDKIREELVGKVN